MPRLLTVMFIIAAGLCSVAPAAPIPKDANRTVLYFPVQKGAKWVYDRPDGETEAVVVAGVERADGEVAVSRDGADGNDRRYAKTVVSAAGLRQDDLDGVPEPVWLLKAPVRAGDSWDVPAGHGGGKRTAHGPEAVEVPAGKFTAARVVWDRPGGRRQTSWYVPGVGEVKRVERAADGTETVTRALKSFTPGK